MCEIFVAVPLTNECCAGRKIVAEQLASASGENPCAHAMENPTLKSGILLAGRVTSRLNSLYSFESGYCVFEGYLFDFLAAFYVEVDIGIFIANIHFVDQVVNETASEF